MTLEIDISETIFKEMYLESGFEKIFAGVTDAVFCGDTADIYVRDIEQFKHFAKRLLGVVKSFES